MSQCSKHGFQERLASVKNRGNLIIEQYDQNDELPTPTLRWLIEEAEACLNSISQIAADFPDADKQVRLDNDKSLAFIRKTLNVILVMDVLA